MSGMKPSLFVSLDGPKGTGKTTLLEAATQRLRAQGLKVIRLCEKKSDPYRGQTMALVNQLARSPSLALERQVCERLAESRRWISQQVLPKQPAGSVILIDRWYPSDAAFRRLVPFEDVLALNMAKNVRVPDLHLGVTTAASISWARAAARGRGLGSTVLLGLQEHVACTDAFEQAFSGRGWVLCRNEGTLEAATEQVVAHIRRLL